MTTGSFGLHQADLAGDGQRRVRVVAGDHDDADAGRRRSARWRPALLRAAGPPARRARSGSCRALRSACRLRRRRGQRPARADRPRPSAAAPPAGASSPPDRAARCRHRTGRSRRPQAPSPARPCSRACGPAGSRTAPTCACGRCRRESRRVACGRQAHRPPAVPCRPAPLPSGRPAACADRVRRSPSGCGRARH